MNSEHVSRNHSAINFLNDEFLLSDCGSRTGTWIAIKNSVELKNGIRDNIKSLIGMNIRIGDYFYIINDVVISKPMLILQSTQDSEIFEIGQEECTFGKSEECDIKLQDDPFIEDYQASITFKDSLFYLSSMSQNGR